MKFIPKTLMVMKHMASIYDGLLIRPGDTLSTFSKGRSIYLGAKIPGQNFDTEFGIGDLNRFFGVYNLFSDPEMEVDQKSITLSSAGKTLKYTLTRTDCIQAPPAGKSPKLRTEDINVSVPRTSLVEVLKAAGALGMPEIAFSCKDGQLSLETYNGRNPTSDVFSTSLGAASSKDFKLAFRIENMKMVPNDYDVTLSFSKSSMWRGTIFEDVDALYMVSAEDTSRV